MRLGIVSDTHGHVVFAAQAARQLESLNVDVLLHCGDVGSEEVVSVLSGWPTHYVVGNCDFDSAPLQRAIESAGKVFHGEFAALEFAGRKVALLHSHDAERFRGTIASGTYDLVCYGHTHQAESHQVGKTLVLNPGALYRANPKSFATVDLPSLEVAFHMLA
jgi:putative phosphoesterase